MVNKRPDDNTNSSNPPNTPPEAAQGSNKADSKPLQAKLMRQYHAKRDLLQQNESDYTIESLLAEAEAIDNWLVRELAKVSEHNATDSKPSTGPASLPELLDDFFSDMLDAHEAQGGDGDIELARRVKAQSIDKLKALITKATARADREGRIDALNKAKQFNKTVYGESIDGMLETYFDDCIAELSLLVEPEASDE